MAKLYDVAVLGDCPAGFTAGGLLARNGHDVVVLSTPSRTVECPLREWAPRNYFKLSEMPERLVEDAEAEAFKKVRYHNVSLDTAVEYQARTPAGYFVRAGDLREATKRKASEAGLKVRSLATMPVIHLREDEVLLEGSSQIRAKVLIIAHGRPSDVISELSLPMRTVPHSSLVVAGLDVPIGSTGQSPGVLNVVELRERTELGMFFECHGALHMRVVSSSAAAGNRAEELSTMVAELQKAELVPAELKLEKAQGAVWRPPAGVARELDSHVAKRCLLTGTAGGFAETITGHSLLPGARSAVLAAEAAMDALDSNAPQDTLMEYKTAWRKALADYLRPPNTSLHMLLPLLFVNQRIVSKFTRALLYGENI